MYLNNLADIARNAGLKVVEVSGWKSRNHGAMKAVRGVVCHHTAGPWGGGNYPSLRVVRDGTRSLAGPLAQLGLGRDGTVYVIANGVSWHAGVVYNPRTFGNYYAIGIEAENSGTGQPWPDEQVDAYARLCAALCKAFNIPVENVQGHKEVCKPRGRKIDPNGLPGDMAGHRTRVKTKMSSNGSEAIFMADSLSPSVKKEIHDTVWFGAPGARLLNVREPGKSDGWADYVLGSMSDWIIRHNIAPMRGEIAALTEFVRELAKGEEVDLAAIANAAQEGTERALRENTVDVDVNVNGNTDEEA